MQKRRDIFTYGMNFEQRNLTLGHIQANKAAGTKIVQTNPSDAETAAAAEEAGIDIIGARYTWISELRKGAPNTYLVAALGGVDLISEEDVLRAGVSVSFDQNVSEVKVLKIYQTHRVHPPLYLMRVMNDRGPA